MSSAASRGRFRVWVVVGVLWLAASVAVFVVLRDAPRAESLVEWLAVSLLAPGVVVVFIGLFFGLWWLLFDVAPRALVRLWRGPPWKTPRPLHPFGRKRERSDYAALMARLTLLRTDDGIRQSIYVDEETGQHWRGEYFEQGFGSGERLTPIDVPANPLVSRPNPD